MSEGTIHNYREFILKEEEIEERYKPKEKIK